MSPDTARRASRRVVDDILDNATAAIFVMDAEHRCTYMNPAAETLTGFTSDELVGRILHDTIHHTQRDGSPYPLIDCPIGCSVLQGDRVRGEETFVHKDGSFYEVAYAASLIRENGATVGAVLEVQDITERVRDRNALRLSDARFRTITDAMPQMVWSARADGGVDYYNRQWHEFTGIVPGAPGAEAWDAVVHPEDRAHVQAGWHASRDAGSDFVVECRLRHRSGDYRWVLGRALPVCDDTGSVLRWMGTYTDIHDQKLNQSALEQSEAALRETDRRKDEFLAMLAHELRNPLAPISTAAQLLQRSPDAPSLVLSAGSIIARQVRHMTDLVDDLLDVSRVTRGQVQLDLQPIDAKDAARAAIEQTRPLIEERRHTLSTHIAPGALPVCGDRTRLVQIITNLLHNAAKYTPPGGRIELHVASDAGTVSIEVVDNGVGIDPALLPHVFDLFTQGERSLARSQGGLGIGLALVRSLVTLHDGTVTADSAGQNQGSRFKVTLPKVAAPATPRVEASTGSRYAAAACPLRIALVDDNQDALQTLSMLLQSYGHEVEVFAAAGGVLKAARNRQYDVFLLDIGLPDRSGYELAQELRRLAHTREATLFALTGYGQSRDAAAAHAAGFDAHFVKPVEPHTLLAALSAVRPMAESLSGVA